MLYLAVCRHYVIHWHTVWYPLLKIPTRIIHTTYVRTLERNRATTPLLVVGTVTSQTLWLMTTHYFLRPCIIPSARRKLSPQSDLSPEQTYQPLSNSIHFLSADKPPCDPYKDIRESPKKYAHIYTDINTQQISVAGIAIDSYYDNSGFLLS